MLSDGTHYVTAMLTSQLNSHVIENRLKKFTVVQLEEYFSNEVQGRKCVDVARAQPGAIWAPLRFFHSPARPSRDRPFSHSPAHRPHPPSSPRRIIIALKLTPIDTPPDIIGQPVSATDADKNAAPPQQQQQQHPNPGGYGANPGYGQQPSAPGYGNAPTGNYGAPPPPSANGNYGGGNGGGYGAGAYRGDQGRGGGGGYGEPPPSYGAYGRGPTARNDAPAKISPISSLNPYNNRWTIRARVTNNPEIRTYHNHKGDGKVFNVELLDAEGGEIKAVAFGDTAERFADVFRAGSVYELSKGQIRPVRNPKFSVGEFEMMLDHNTEVREIDDPAVVGSIKRVNYAFKKIADVDHISSGSLVDVCAVVHHVGELNTIMKRDGGETSKRSITLRDDSGASIELTLWAPQALDIGGRLEGLVNDGDHPVIAIKNGRVGDFQGKNIGTINSSRVDINPDVDEAARLRHWYDTGGATAEVKAFSGAGASGGGGRGDRCVTIAQLKEEIARDGATPAFWGPVPLPRDVLEVLRRGVFLPPRVR